MLTAAVAIFALGWVPVFLLRSERLRARTSVATPDVRRAIWNAVAAVTVHVILVELALTSPDGPAPPTLTLAIAIAVFVLGLAFWGLARHTLVTNGRFLDPAQPPPMLVTTGPFSLVRHPLALGMIILALGPALAATRILTWVSFAVVVLAMARRCLQDEVELFETFGEAYERYAATTPRLVPFVW
jgi:protein-S-isoprenylcysteine O-methyltransferase Ste14